MATKVDKSPFPRTLPPLRCAACGTLHYTTRREAEGKAATTRCLYCGHPHTLVGGRWVRT